MALATARAVAAEASGDLTEAAGRYAECARVWLSYGSIPERGHALLGEGRCRLALGEDEAVDRLHAARDVFEALGATPMIRRADALLGDEAAAIS
jgi:hypothetical protein